MPFSFTCLKGWIKSYYKGEHLVALLEDNMEANWEAAIREVVMPNLSRDPNNQICSYDELLCFLKELGVAMKYKALHKFANHHFDVKLKVGRKSNIKKDTTAVAVFKTISHNAKHIK